MKYIIPENKLDKIVFRYLDLNLKGLEKRKPKYYKGIVYGFPDEKYGVLRYENNGTLYIYYRLIYKISEVFGLKESDSKLVITKWVSDRFQLKVINTWTIIRPKSIRLAIESN